MADTNNCNRVREQESLLGGVRNRVTSFIKRKRKLDASKFAALLQGGVISLTINEVYVQLVLKNAAEQGYITTKINDILFLSLSMMEFFLAPLLSYYGKRRRTNLIAAWFMLTVLVTVPMMFLSMNTVSVTGLELCQAHPPKALPSSKMATARIVFLIMLAVSTQLAKIIVFTHGVAILDEHDPGNVAKYLGTLFGFRVFMWVAARKFLHSMLESSAAIQAVALFAPILLKSVLLLVLYPTSSLQCDDEEGKAWRGDGGFLASLNRVLRCKTAMFNMLSLAFIITGAWGYSMSNSDIVRFKFHIAIDHSDFYAMLVTLNLFMAIIFMITILGYKFSVPIMSQFDKMAAAKKAAAFSMFVIVMVMSMFLFKCNTSAIQGVSNRFYSQPSCSNSCGCTFPYNSFNPVCLLNNMTTYYSPCHAGCTVQQDVNGHKILNNCLCGTNMGRTASWGSCDTKECYSAYSNHIILYVSYLGVVVMITLLNMMQILRAVDPRDKSLAVGVAISITAFFAYIGGHLSYWQLSEWSCLWWEGGLCQLHGQQFLTHVTIATCLATSVSIVINIVNYIIVKRNKEM